MPLTAGRREHQLDFCCGNVLGVDATDAATFVVYLQHDVGGRVHITLKEALQHHHDYTPMEFVVMVLQRFFQRDMDTATHIMLQIHHEGRGVCGVYPKDVAATKVELVLTAARREGHPLQCIMEAA